MRFFLLVLAVIAAALLAPARATATPTRSIVLHASVVDYYSNRFILTADGDVSARFSDGSVVRGETFAMDLKLNRFVIAGHVRVSGPHGSATGAALAGYPDLDRIYFLPEGDQPDRWTFYGLDFTDNHAGRQQPGDAFYLPDLTGQRPYIIAQSATIFLKNNVEFPPGSRILALAAYVPTPGYVVNYSSNPNFYQNAFSGAVFDIGVPFTGSATTIAAFHLRYTQYQGAYLAFDFHYVRDLDYYVFSVNPLTQSQRQWNFIGYHRESPALESRLFFQLSTLSSPLFAQPSQAASYANLQFNAKVGKYATSLNIDQFNNDLLGGAADAFSAYGARQSGHPSDALLSINSFEDEWRIFRYIGVPLKFQYRAGYGFQHDGYGVPTIQGLNDDNEYTFGGAVYPTIYETFLGLTVYTSSVKIAKQTTMSFKADDLVQAYSLPHHIRTTTTTTTVAYTPTTTKIPAFYVAYNTTNVGDFYGAQQLLAYPPGNDVISTAYGSFSGQSAFRGFATSRNYTGSMVYTPTPYFALNLTLQRFYVTPAPVPGAGGSPPWDFSGDVRVRVSPHILVDLSRSYYFNWANEGWSPQWTLQFSP